MRGHKFFSSIGTHSIIMIIKSITTRNTTLITLLPDSVWTITFGTTYIAQVKSIKKFRLQFCMGTQVIQKSTVLHESVVPFDNLPFLYTLDIYDRIRFILVNQVHFQSYQVDNRNSCIWFFKETGLFLNNLETCTYR